MKVRILFALVFLFVGRANAQFAERFDYGLSFQFNVPVYKSVSNDTLSVRAGWGASFFGNYAFNEQWKWHNAFGYDQTKIFHDFDNTGTTFNSGSFYSSALYSPPAITNSWFEFGLVGSYSFNSRKEILDVTKASGVRSVNIKPDEDWDIGLTIGLGFDINPQFGLRVNYTEFVRSKQFTNDISGRPEQLQVALDIRFNKLSELSSNQDDDSAYRALFKLKNEGTMVFMLPTKMAQIRSMTDSTERERFIRSLHNSHLLISKAIAKNYRFSNYVICYDTSAKSMQANQSYEYFLDTNLNYIDMTTDSYVMYALVGENFYSDFRRWTTGIYVYNSDFELMQDPFPYFSQYRERDATVDVAEAVDLLFGKFNADLMTQFQYLKPTPDSP